MEVLSQSMLDVIGERRRQIRTEGFDLKHDDQHDSGDLACAGAAYALNAGCQLNPYNQNSLDEAPIFWPEEWDGWWKPKDARRDLVRAAALLIAEIDRIDRNVAKKEQS